MDETDMIIRTKEVLTINFSVKFYLLVRYILYIKKMTSSIKYLNQ